MKLRKIHVALSALLLATFCTHGTSPSHPKEGVLVRAQCASNSSLGILAFQQFDPNNPHRSITTWYRVNSNELCMEKIAHALFPEQIPVVIAMTADNLMSDVVQLVQLEIHDGVVVSLKKKEKMSKPDIDTNEIHDEYNVWSWYSRSERLAPKGGALLR